MATYLNTNGSSESFDLTERYIYGSSRVGVYKEPVSMLAPPSTPPFNYVRPGYRQYELSNHLGNVTTTITAQKVPLYSGTTITGFAPQIVKSFDYSPFGVTRVDNDVTARLGGAFAVDDGVRYGFNGKEKDDEVKGSGNHYSFGDYGLDPRIGRRWNLDPMAYKNTSFTPYVVYGNNPIIYIDPDGLDWLLATGNSVSWYGGDYGDKTTLIKVYKATSGKVIHYTDGSEKNVQFAKYQYVKNYGPTVEGKYKLELNADPEKKAKIFGGDIVRPKINGIESLENMTVPNQPGRTYNSTDWGKNRIRMIPVDVSQPVDLDGEQLKGDERRDLTSFYFHDSEKGYSSGCHEVEGTFFDDLKQYQAEGNKSIDVKVEYSDPDQSTNGGTKKK